MEITFHGATEEVTGSCLLLHVAGKRILLDCGLIQGSPEDEKRNREPFPFAVDEIDAVVLSHAHIDHSGRIPLLVKRGYAGPIYCHPACRDLCEIMLRDAGYLEEREVEWVNRKRQRKGLKPIEPLYTMRDAEACIAQFECIDYGQSKEMFPGVSATLHDAGHILGSAIVQMDLVENHHRRRVVYSGDLGHGGLSILRDVTYLQEADLVVMESTYGDRLHRPWQSTWEELRDVVEEVQRAKGVILIPAFAVGRTQEILYLFGRYYEEWNLDRWQIFLDSPLAIEATDVYTQHLDLFADEVKPYMKRLAHDRLLPNLHFTPAAEDSMKLNRIESGAIIIAGSGMCTGGRIKQHLKHHVWREETHVVIVGFQAAGTIGRALVEGAKHIRLWGETVRVAATVHTIGGLSAHADQQRLLDWYGHYEKRPPVALVHGEPVAVAQLATKLREEFAAKVFDPARGTTWDIIHAKPVG